MFENPRRGMDARNFTTNVSKILDLKSSPEQIFSRKLSLGAPEDSLQAFSSFSAGSFGYSGQATAMLTILCLIIFKGKITIQKSNNTERTINYKERNLFLFIKVIPQKLKLPMNFF